MNKEKSYTLTPSWKYFFLAYLLSVLTIPIIVGIVALYFVRRRHKSIKYTIFDTGITAVDSKYQQNIDLIDIQNIELKQNRLHRQLNVGTLILQTKTAKMVLEGLEQPWAIKDLIEKAVRDLKKQTKETTESERTEPEHEPGKMEKMNYLTGLWQQGLISDEDFEEERKHFE